MTPKTRAAWLCIAGLVAACGSTPTAPATPTPTPTAVPPTVTVTAPPATATPSPRPTATAPAATFTPTPAAPPATAPPTATRRPAAPNTPVAEPPSLSATNAGRLIRLARWPLSFTPEALEFSSSGRSLWAAGAGQSEVWRVRDGVRIRHERGPALSADGLWRLDTVGASAAQTGGADSLIYILTDLRAGHELTRWSDPGPAMVADCGLNACDTLRFAPNAGTLAEIEDFSHGRERPTLKLWGRDGQLIQSAPGIQAFVYSPDGLLLITRRPTTPPIDIWRVRDGGLLQSIAPGLAVRYMALAPDNGWLTLADDAQVQVWNWAVGTQTATWPAAGLAGLAFNADGSLVVGGFADHLAVWRAGDGQLLLTAGLTAGGPVAVSPDGRYVAVAAAGGLELWGVWPSP